MGAGGEHSQRVAVGRSLLCGHDTDDAGRAAAVVDHDRPAVLRADPLGDNPRDAVVRSAGGVGHDDANRLSRIWLGAPSERSQPCEERGRDEKLGCGTAGQKPRRGPRGGTSFLDKGPPSFPEPWPETTTLPADRPAAPPTWR